LFSEVNGSFWHVFIDHLREKVDVASCIDHNTVTKVGITRSTEKLLDIVHQYLHCFGFFVRDFLLIVKRNETKE